MSRDGYIGRMNGPVGDPDFDDAIAAGVDRGEFATIEEARADFWAKLDESLAELDAGLGEDAEVVFDRLQERYANWPRAAAE